MRVADIVTCPFCGEKVRLGHLPIVATNVTRGSHANSPAPSSGGLFGGLNRPEESGDPPLTASPRAPQGDATVRPVSGAEVLDTVNGWPVVAHAPASIVDPSQRSLLSRIRGGPQLPPPSELAKPEDLPARLCSSCETPLPVDIDERPLFTIAVVGTNGSAKTHFLTSALHEAYHEQALDAFACTEFAPDEVTSERYHNDYYRPLFSDRVALESTQVGKEDVRFHPLAFRVAFEQSARPAALLFHDVAGEVLRDRAARAKVAPFVRRADAVIFLIDPRWFPPVASYLEKEHGIPNEMARFNQADLFNAVAEEMRSRNLAHIPVAVALSKSDLISAALGRKFTFDRETPSERDAWVQQIKEIDGEVVELLTGDLRARDLVAAIKKFPDVTYHAVAPIGSQPSPPDARNQQTIAELKPRRCLDPLVSVLQFLMKI
jgi:hypothetical protein